VPLVVYRYLQRQLALQRQYGRKKAFLVTMGAW